MCQTRTRIMNKIVSVLLLLTCCFGPTFGQDMEDARTFEKRSLTDLIVELVEAQLKLVKIKDVTGKIGSVEYNLSNIKIANLGNIKPHPAQFADGDIDLKLTWSSLSMTADWWVRSNTRKSFTESGSMIVRARDISVTVSLSLGNLKVQSCRSHVDLTVDVRQGDSGTPIAKFIKSPTFIKSIGSKLEDMICDAVYDI